MSAGGMSGMSGYPGAASGGLGGESMNPSSGSSSGSTESGAPELPVVDTIYLKLKAKNILPRERETLNSQFALLLAKRFRASPMFVDSDDIKEGTVVMGNVPPGDSSDRWFEFTLKLTLAQEIRMQDKGGAE